MGHRYPICGPPLFVLLFFFKFTTFVRSGFCVFRNGLISISDWVFGNVWSCSTLFIMKTSHKSDELNNLKKGGVHKSGTYVMGPRGTNRNYTYSKITHINSQEGKSWWLMEHDIQACYKYIKYIIKKNPQISSSHQKSDLPSPWNKNVQLALSNNQSFQFNIRFSLFDFPTYENFPTYEITLWYFSLWVIYGMSVSFSPVPPTKI